MNNKSISERLNNVNDKGPDKWLSRNLFEAPRGTPLKDMPDDDARIQNMRRRAALLQQARAPYQGTAPTPPAPTPAPTPKPTPAPSLDLTSRNRSMTQQPQPTPSPTPRATIQNEPNDATFGNVNQSKYVTGSGSGDRYHTGRGGGESKYFNENNILELLFHRLERGIDPRSDEGRNIAIDGHRNVSQGTRAQQRDFEEKVRSAQESAAAYIQDMDEENVAPGLYSYSKKGGQNTDIPDEFRSNIGDDIFDLYLDGMSQLMGKKPLSYRGGQPTAKSLEERRKQMRRDVQAFYFGGGEAANLEDAFQTADIYMVKKEREQAIMAELKQHIANFGQSLFNAPTKMDGELLTQAFLKTLSEAEKSGDMHSISLKQVPRNMQANVASHNMNRDDFHEITDVDMSESQPNMRLDMGEIEAGTNLGRFGNSYENNVIGMPGARNIAAAGDMSRLNNDDNVPLKFFSANKRWDGYKVEPQSAGAKLGEFNMGQLHEIFKEFGLEGGINNMVPRMGIVGDRLSDLIRGDGTYKPKAYEQLNNIEPFTDEHSQHWGDMIDEFQRTAPESIRFNDEDFQYRGKQLKSREWIQKIIGDATIKPEEANQMMVKRDGADFHQLESRSYVNTILNNLNMMNLFNKSHQADNENGIKKLMAQFIYGAQNKNHLYQDDDTDEIAQSLDIPKQSSSFFWPRHQISGK